MSFVTKASSTLRRTNLETEVSVWKRIRCFPSPLRRRNLKTQQLPLISDTYLRKTRSSKSRDYRDDIVFEKVSVFEMFSDFSIHI